VQVHAGARGQSLVKIYLPFADGGMACIGSESQRMALGALPGIDEHFMTPSLLAHCIQA
jgi:hypothetical protein